MLAEYEAEQHTGMNQKEISETIFFYTNGYPYLVSYLCKWIDEQGGKVWTKEQVKKAVNHLIKEGSTLVDDLIKNYENNAGLQRMIDQILFNGESFAFVKTDSVINLGSTLGILSSQKDMVAISNLIFEDILINHAASKKHLEGLEPVFII